MQSCFLQAGAVVSYNKANSQPVQNTPVTHHSSVHTELCMRCDPREVLGLGESQYLGIFSSPSDVKESQYVAAIAKGSSQQLSRCLRSHIPPHHQLYLKETCGI